MLRTTVSSRSGFTIVELVVVIGIAAVLAAVAVPKMIGPDGFASRGFYDQAQTVVRYAQKTAIAWRRPVFVCVTVNAVTAATAAGCANPINNPVVRGGNVPLTVTAPSGVTLAPANFSFDAAGRPNPNGTITIAVTSTIPGDPARQIVVEAETGYVRR
ncbi:MAG: GspH/FimT family pseudopilin [Burkholderiales bacterium]|nr:GspH/FimT family pseudopilin [Burkholderiales bacterium]